MRRSGIVLAIALGLVAAGAASGIVLAFKGTNQAGVSRSAYLRRANAVCAEYGRKLDRVPPPTDPASPGAVYESIGLALPLLREQEAEIRALERPPELEARVDEFFALTDESLRHLERTRRHAGLRELFPMVQALNEFEKSRNAAKRVGRSIGFKC